MLAVMATLIRSVSAASYHMQQSGPQMGIEDKEEDELENKRREEGELADDDEELLTDEEEEVKADNDKLKRGSLYVRLKMHSFSPKNNFYSIHARNSIGVDSADSIRQLGRSVIMKL